MADLSISGADAALGAILPAGTTFYLGLNTADPGSTGADTTALPFQSITFGTAASGSVASTSSQSFTNVPGSVTYTNYSVWSGPSTTLTTALTSGTAYTSLAVDALPAALAVGATVTTVAGTATQTWTVSTAASAGATTISVNSAAANAAYAAGSVVVEGTYVIGGALTSSVTPPAGSTIDVAVGAITQAAS